MSTPQTKLEKLIIEAKLHVRLCAAKLTQAEAANIPEALPPLKKKFHAASEKKESFEFLVQAPEEHLKKLLEHAADRSRFADSLEARSPAKAKKIRQEVSGIEKRYLLWCEHHGKDPHLLSSLRSEPQDPVTPEVKEFTLLKFIAKAKADSERILAEYNRVKTSGRKKDIQRLETNFSIASSTLKFYEGLTTASEPQVLARIHEIAKNRKEASRYEFSNPPLAESLLAAANSVEQSYLLWCEYHGKTPMPEFQNIPLLPPAEPKQITGRGGRRDGAGRPALGKVQLLFKCSKATADKARELAKARGVTLGGLLDLVIDSISA